MVHKPISPERLDYYVRERLNYIASQTVAEATKAFGAVLPEVVVRQIDEAVESLQPLIRDAMLQRDAIWAEE